MFQVSAAEEERKILSTRRKRWEFEGERRMRDREAKERRMCVIRARCSRSFFSFLSPSPSALRPFFLDSFFFSFLLSSLSRFE